MSGKLALISTRSGKVLKKKWDSSSPSLFLLKAHCPNCYLGSTESSKIRTVAQWSKFSKKYLQNAMATEPKKLSSISMKPLAIFPVVSKVGTRQFIGMWEKILKLLGRW